jgi:hypothetical protein
MLDKGLLRGKDTATAAATESYCNIEEAHPYSKARNGWIHARQYFRGINKLKNVKRLLIKNLWIQVV